MKPNSVRGRDAGDRGDREPDPHEPEGRTEDSDCRKLRRQRAVTLRGGEVRPDGRCCWLELLGSRDRAEEPADDERVGGECHQRFLVGARGDETLGAVEVRSRRNRDAIQPGEEQQHDKERQWHPRGPELADLAADEIGPDHGCSAS